MSLLNAAVVLAPRASLAIPPAEVIKPLSQGVSQHAISAPEAASFLAGLDPTLANRTFSTRAAMTALVTVAARQEMAQFEEHLQVVADQDADTMSFGALAVMAQKKYPDLNITPDLLLAALSVLAPTREEQEDAMQRMGFKMTGKARHAQDLERSKPILAEFRRCLEEALSPLINTADATLNCEEVLQINNDGYNSLKYKIGLSFFAVANKKTWGSKKIGGGIWVINLPWFGYQKELLAKIEIDLGTLYSSDGGSYSYSPGNTTASVSLMPQFLTLLEPALKNFESALRREEILGNEYMTRQAIAPVL